MAHRHKWRAAGRETFLKYLTRPMRGAGLHVEFRSFPSEFSLLPRPQTQRFQPLSLAPFENVVQEPAVNTMPQFLDSTA